MKQGARTAEFGQWLLQHVRSVPRYQDCRVYYDHGDSENDPHVCAIEGFWGDVVENSNRLADVDVVLARSNGEIVCLIEIEETRVAPKKLIGDVFAILMCNHFAVRWEESYLTVTLETELIVAGVGGVGGKHIDRARMIKSRLEQFEVPGDSIALRNVKLVVEENLSATLERLREMVNRILANRPSSEVA